MPFRSTTGYGKRRQHMIPSFARTLMLESYSPEMVSPDGLSFGVCRRDALRDGPSSDRTWGFGIGFGDFGAACSGGPRDLARSQRGFFVMKRHSFSRYFRTSAS